jgi:hypothetical protein
VELGGPAAGDATIWPPEDRPVHLQARPKRFGKLTPTGRQP